MLRAWVLAGLMVAWSATNLGAANDSGANDIGGTGRIVPRDGVVLISGVPGATIKSIRVHVGEVVKRGAPLMALDDSEARSDVDLAEIAAKQAKSAAARSIADHALVIGKAEARLARAEEQLKIYRELGPNATSQKQITDLEAAVKDADVDLQLERSRDSQIRADAAASTASASRRLELAREKLSDYQIAAPSNGTILQIDQRVGERLTGGPAIELGDLTTMYVVCQVFQGDLLKLRPGMKATIKSRALDQSLTGTIDQIGRLIDTKAQLGEARIKLDDPSLPSRLVGMEVEVQIAR
jgi:HlyD family secretion protein